MGEKFRSVRAFSQYRNTRSKMLDPMRILELIKRAGGSLTKGELQAELAAPLDALDAAIEALRTKDLVRVESGEEPSRDRVSL